MMFAKMVKIAYLCREIVNGVTTTMFYSINNDNSDNLRSNQYLSSAYTNSTQL